MFIRKSLIELEQELLLIEIELEKNQISSKVVQQANELIESSKGRSKEFIEAELSSRGLPSLQELGLIQIQNLFPYGKLFRKKKLVEKKIEKLKSRDSRI